MEKLYALLYSFNFNEALRLSKDIYKPSEKGKGFFITHSDDELLDKIKAIRKCDILLGMGFTEKESSMIKTIFCVFYLVPKFNLNQMLSDSIENIEIRLKKSSKIKNKDIPFRDLKCLLLGEKL